VMLDVSGNQNNGVWMSNGIATNPNVSSTCPVLNEPVPLSCVCFVTADKNTVQSTQILPLVNSDYTITLWAFVTSGTSGNLFFFSQGVTAGDQGLQVGFYGNTQTIIHSHYADDLQINVAEAGGQWHYWTFAFSFANKMRYIYMNGVLIGQSACNPLAPSTATFFNVGAGVPNYSAYFTGLLQQLVVYARVLTGVEVNNMYFGVTVSTASLLMNMPITFPASGPGPNIADISGNGYNGIYMNATGPLLNPAYCGGCNILNPPLAPPTDNCVTFAQSKSNYIKTPSIPDIFYQNYTVSAWVRLSAFGSPSFDTMFVGAGTANTDQALFVGFTSPIIFVYRHYNDDESVNMLNVNGQWHQWTMVYTAPNKQRLIYQDGLLIDVSTANPLTGSGGPAFYIGTRLDASTSFFNGQIQNVQVYSRALSAAEANALFHNTPVSQTNVELSFPVTSALKDLSTNNRNGIYYTSGTVSTPPFPTSCTSN